MSNSPNKVPGYLAMDAASPWHIAALQVAGLESMTITTRLRASLGGRGTLQDLEDTINSTGKRRIAKFEMSIADPDVLSVKAAYEAMQAEKIGSMTSRRTSEDNDQLTNFDIDTFTRDYRAGPRAAKKEHIFGRAEVSRGDWSLPDDSGRDPHDRFDRGPSVQRCVGAFPDSVSSRTTRATMSCCSQSPLLLGPLTAITRYCLEYETPKLLLTHIRFTAPILFPRLDSFPASIFDVGSGHAANLAIHAGLSTSTAVANQIRAVEQIAKRLSGIEEREALCNGLQVLAEEYDEGWDSGSDSDDDE